MWMCYELCNRPEEAQIVYLTASILSCNGVGLNLSDDITRRLG
jgi:hypothetical protein